MEGITPNRRPHDPNDKYNFKVEIEGVTQAAFNRVEGLESITEVIEYQDGDDLILRYNYFEGRPCRWTWGALDSMRDGISLERVEIAVEKIERG